MTDEPVDKKPPSPRDGDSPPPRPEFRPGRPPVQTLILWALVLFALPLAIFFIGQQRKVETVDLSQSDFEKHLEAGRVTEAVVVREPSLGIKEIQGRYVLPSVEAPHAPDAETVPFRADVVYTDRLDELLREHCPERESKTVSNVWGGVLVSVLPILVLVGVIYFLFSRQLKAAGRGALQFGKSRARLMTPSQEPVTFADIAGIDEAKEELQEVVDFLRAPQKFQKIGGRIPKGVLMVGPPGTGKTLLARAISGEAGVAFFSISGSDFVEMFVGVGASRVRDMFEEGKRHAPCLIFIDEIDAVGRSRFSGIGGGHDEREQTLNAMLAEMDGFEPNVGIIVLAATNRPDVLDPALMRPGRFDRRIVVDLPDMNGRLGILKIHAKKVKLDPAADLGQIAKGTPGFSGADLANLINEAALAAARGGKPMILQEDLEEARDKVRWGKERRSRAIDEKDRAVTAYHEAGHTIISLLCEHAPPLHKVTIIPRGISYLGATMSLPERDRYTMTHGELADELAVLMGGRLAEQMVFKDVTTGAAMDLRQATELARRMVCEWGMSPKLGPLAYGHREEHIYLGRDITRTEDYSEETAREIDQEIRAILAAAEHTAERLLGEHREALELLGRTLLERETMTAEEIVALVGIRPRNGRTYGVAAVAESGAGAQVAEGKEETGGEPNTNSK
ncbi:MAG: ATP-dependent zinc metalloprotease FtsH [Lentisphaerae bacterium ADurb.BinA184]|nr:MAG: ATP-dependent zinc metalloprotease FtsH [Lentisphaerae bacterium ADurb.BinA184]